MVGQVEDGGEYPSSVQQPAVDPQSDWQAQTEAAEVEDRACGFCTTKCIWWVIWYLMEVPFISEDLQGLSALLVSWLCYCLLKNQVQLRWTHVSRGWTWFMSLKVPNRLGPVVLWSVDWDWLDLLESVEDVAPVQNSNSGKSSCLNLYRRWLIDVLWRGKLQ